MTMRKWLAAAALLWIGAAATASAEDLSQCEAAAKAVKTDPAAAKADLKSCLAKGQLKPENAAEAHVRLAALALEGKRWNEVIAEYGAAESVLTKAGKTFQPSARLYYNRALAYLGLKQLPKARADLDRAAKLAPKEMPIIVARMSVLAAQGQIDAALADGATLAAQPEKQWQVIGHARRMELFEMKHQLQNAYTESEALLKADPDNLEILASRAQLLNALGKRDQILADTEKLLKSGNAAAQFSAHTIRGAVFDEEKKYDAALKEADAAIALNPKDPLGHNNRCMAKAYLGDTDEAIASCKKAMEIAPKSPNVWNSMGFAYEKAGKLSDALGYYQKVAAAQPKNQGNLADLKRVQAALAAQGVAAPTPASAAPPAVADKPAADTPFVVKPSGATVKPAKKKRN
jgi:tetratricopeptide (TPR) repeat protein